MEGRLKEIAEKYLTNDELNETEKDISYLFWKVVKYEKILKSAAEALEENEIT